MVIGSTGIGSGVVSYVFEMGESTVDWNLISVLENNETNVTNPSYASIDIAAGRIVVGMPEDSSSVESGGSVQQFSNLGWQSVRQQKFPPFFDRSTPRGLSLSRIPSVVFPTILMQRILLTLVSLGKSLILILLVVATK